MNYRMKIKNVSNNKFSHQSGEIPGRWLNFLSYRKVLHPRSKDRFFQKWTVSRSKNHEKFILQISENRILSCRLSQVYVVYGIFNTRGKKDAIIVLTTKRFAALVGQDIDSEIYALKMRSMVSLNKKGEHTNENDG